MHVNRRNSTNSIFQFLGNVHNISSNQSISGGSLFTLKIFTSYSGIYHWLHTIGVRSESDVYTLSFSLEVLSFIFMVLGYLHSKIEESTYFVSTDKSIMEIAYISPGYRLNYHIGSLLGITSVLWSIHIISVSIPVSRGISAFNYSIHFVALLNLDWINFSIRQDGFTHIHGSFESSGTSVLTFIGGINRTTGALYQRL